MGFISDPWFIAFMGIFIGLMGLIFGTTVHGYYSMKYVVTSESLMLKWSYVKKTIPLQEISSISSVTKEHLQGIRSFGVGIPGHLVGRFRLKFNGEFLATTLYATDLNHLVVIRTFDNKTYGITPDKKDEFMQSILTRQSSITKTDLDTAEPIRVTEEVIKKTRIWLAVLFLICVSLSVATFVYFLVLYQMLPETGVPLHWGIGGVVDRFGNKTELLTMMSIFTGVELLISTLVYIWMRRSDLGKVKIGKIIMLFPLIINLVFSTLIIVITYATLSYF